MPHSDTHGSKPARGSPWLFAACHVLHRLLVPRHPPNALLALNRPTCTETSHSSRHARPQCKQDHHPSPYNYALDLRTRFWPMSQKRTNLFTCPKNTWITGSSPSLHRRQRASCGPEQPDRIPPVMMTSTPRAPPKGWRRTGSNRRPPACKAGALPAELRPHNRVGRPPGDPGPLSASRPADQDGGPGRT